MFDIGHLFIDLYRGTRVLRDIAAIKKELCTGRANLQRLQELKLCKLLFHLKRNVPFYIPLLHEFSSADLDNKPYDILHTLPVIEKDLIKNNWQHFLSRIPFCYEESYTAGSTGEPFKYYIDKRSISRTKAFDLFFWSHASQYNLKDRVLVIGGSVIGGGAALKIRIYNHLQHRAYLNTGIIGKDEIEKKLKILLYGNYCCIYGYPSTIEFFVEEAKKRNLEYKHKIKGIFSTSELLLPQTRRIIETYFRANIYDDYGARDGGVVATECSQRQGMHYNFQDCYLEEYHSSDSKTSLSELLLTNLDSFQLPFVRYRVGDFAELTDEPCCCGLILPRILKLHGRTRDIIKRTDGGIVHSVMVNKLVKNFSYISRFQIIQHTDLSITVILKYNLRPNKNQLMAFIKDLHSLFPYGQNININDTGEFVFGENGKFKTVIFNA